MASLIENMISILEEEELLYEQLLGLGTEKTEVIIRNDIERLQQITAKEQEIVEQVLPVEKRRAECIKDMSIVISKPEEEITVKVLMDMMKGKPEIQDRLARIHDKFGALIRNLRLLNERNNALIRETLDIIQFELNLNTALRQTPMTADYDRSAQNTGMHMSGRGYFDIKQ
ncbi:MAG: flagellar protein FlgN [Lachnospiraceae bacterium]|nr:flagellar protein FlgN [Lachnospiraceae bacterium]